MKYKKGLFNKNFLILLKYIFLIRVVMGFFFNLVKCKKERKKVFYMLFLKNFKNLDGIFCYFL